MLVEKVFPRLKSCYYYCEKQHTALTRNMDYFSLQRVSEDGRLHESQISWMRVFCQNVWRAYEKRLLSQPFSDLVLDDLFVVLPILLVSEYKGNSDSLLRLYRYFAAPYAHGKKDRPLVMW